MVFRSRSKRSRSVRALAEDIAAVRSSADRSLANLNQLVDEQLFERAQADARRRNVAVTGLVLAIISGAVSVYLLTTSLPPDPTASEPGRIGIVFPADVSDMTIWVDAEFDASVD